MIIINLLKALFFYPLLFLRKFVKETLVYFSILGIFSTILFVFMSVTRPPFPYLYGIIAIVASVLSYLWGKFYDEILFVLNPTGKEVVFKDEDDYLT